MSGTEKNEEMMEWVRKAQDGGQSAREMVVLAYRPMVCTAIKKYVYDHSLWEEAYQEGQLAILKAIDDYDGDRGVYFSVFLRKTLYYAMMDLNRRSKRPEMDSLEAQNRDEEGLTLAERLEDERADVDGHFETQERRRALAGWIEGLPAGQRRIIEGRYGGEIKPRELAENLGLSIKTVENLHTRAIKRLREQANQSGWK